MQAATTHDSLTQPETKRSHEQLRQYWQSLKESRPYPAEAEIEPQAVPDVWPYCFLVDLRSGGVEHGFHYEYMGRELIEAYGADMVGIGHCDAKTAPHIATMLALFDEVVESGEPAVDESEFTNIRGVGIKYRCCLLPLGRDKVEYILGCMRWKYS